jgi:hypothetical protein
LDQQTLEAQSGLADVLLDIAQALFGMLLEFVEALVEILLPMGNVLFQHLVLTMGENFINQILDPGVLGLRTSGRWTNGFHG